MNSRLYFVMEYEPSAEVGPPHIACELNHEEYEWPLFTADPYAIGIKKDYVCTIIDPEIESIGFDFYGDQSYMVSERFCDLCTEFSVPFRPVPVTLVLKGQQFGRYFFFLPVKYIALVDAERSEFELDTCLDTGRPLADQLFPPTPVYKKITKLVPSTDEPCDLFSCIEIAKLVCTSDFRNRVIQEGLKDIRFTPIHEFVYDPWAGW